MLAKRHFSVMYSTFWLGVRHMDGMIPLHFEKFRLGLCQMAYMQEHGICGKLSKAFIDYMFRNPHDVVIFSSFDRF